MARHLVAVQEIFQQLGIVVGHLLEVRDAPAFVHRVTMKAASNLIVHAAERHALESALGDMQEMRVARGLMALEQQIHSARVGKLGRLAEAAMLLVEKMERGFNDCVNGSRIEFAASAV